MPAVINPEYGVSYAANIATTSATLLGTEVSGGKSLVNLNMTGTLGAGANATMPTVSALLANILNPSPMFSYTLRIYNTSSGNFAWTVLTNTGWTLVGTSFAITQNTCGEFAVIVNALAATATLQSLGQFTPAGPP